MLLATTHLCDNPQKKKSSFMASVRLQCAVCSKTMLELEPELAARLLKIQHMQSTTTATARMRMINPLHMSRTAQAPPPHRLRT